MAVILEKLTVMLEIDMPGFGSIKLEYLVSDFTGTLSLDGNLLPKAREKLNVISQFLKIFVLTADEFGKAREELKDVNCTVHVMEGDNVGVQKREFVRKLGAEKVVALGNGANDREMLKGAKLGIIIAGMEGCAVEALMASDIQVTTFVDGLDLLLNPRRLRATLRI